MWMIEYLKSAQKDVQKLDPQIRVRIREYLEQRIARLKDPRQLAEPLKGQLTKLWRYRVGDYRIVCELRDDELIVIVVRIGHRKNVYKK